MVGNQESSIRIIPLDSRDDWMEAVNGLHDFYHLPFFHELAKDLEEGEPILFVYEGEGYRISLPLLIRPIETSLDSSGEKPWFDATSVYGYPGPVVSHSDIPDAIKRDFRESLTRALTEIRVVSLFSRLHPFLNQDSLVAGLGTLVSQGHTVSIDLSIPEEFQIAQYRENHRRGLRKLRGKGAFCYVDEDFRHLDSFIKIYGETMSRVRATEDYIFPRNYFQKFVSTAETEVKLFVCEIGSEIACAGIFTKCGDIVQYHLGGTSHAALKFSPMKLVLDTARHWGYEHGAKIMHIGGGVGTRDDSLFQFKAGFSNRLHTFNTWRWVLLQSVYDQLVAAFKASQSTKVQPDQPADFFPLYRS
jgi:Acetyltransferase (GNAT) domain